MTSFSKGLQTIVSENAVVEDEWFWRGLVQIKKYIYFFSGSVIRSMRRLEELMRQMVQASKNIGNTELENKFSEAIKLLKRDIVFAASLYL